MLNHIYIYMYMYIYTICTHPYLFMQVGWVFRKSSEDSSHFHYYMGFAISYLRCCGQSTSITVHKVTKSFVLEPFVLSRYIFKYWYLMQAYISSFANAILICLPPACISFIFQHMAYQNNQFCIIIYIPHKRTEIIYGIIRINFLF